MDHKRKKIKCMNHEGKECCMCGDVGFQESLFRCQKCHHRFQHLYCSKLYSDQLELDSINVCDWCLDFKARQKIQSQKRKVALQEMQSGKEKKVASESTSAMKQPGSITFENPRKANAKPGSHKLGVKVRGSKQNQPFQSLREDCKLSIESCRSVPYTSSQRNTTKSTFSGRYKLLSDVLCS